MDIKWQLVSLTHHLPILAQVPWFFSWNTQSLVASISPKITLSLITFYFACFLVFSIQLFSLNAGVIFIPF